MLETAAVREKRRRLKKKLALVDASKALRSFIYIALERAIELALPPGASLSPPSDFVPLSELAPGAFPPNLTWRFLVLLEGPEFGFNPEFMYIRPTALGELNVRGLSVSKPEAWRPV